MGADTQDRIPREAIELAAREIPQSNIPEATIARYALEAAYPLTFRAIRQELAGAMRWESEQDSVHAPPGTAKRYAALAIAADWIESYGGASPGGEHG
jgi:hypothetical protein